MKQVVQSLKDGHTEITDVPCPQVRPGHLLIQSRVSLISAGTERMLLEFGKAGWIGKARQQPDRLRAVLDKVRTDGLVPTIDAIRSRLDEPLPLGYCNVGTVLATGSGAGEFEVGQRVVSNGHHAEIVCVPKNLCAKISDRVTDETAAFTVLSAIALQGIRLAEPTLGESFAVSGLGLVGLLTVQLLRANGCRVLGIDFDASRLALAREFGAETVDLSRKEDPVQAAMEFSDGRGMDGVLIAAATKSNEPVHQAALMSRKRGRIVLVGVTGLELSRADFFEKELSFRVSCSYGPGRYDSRYEQEGHDYPIGFVRWTEQRNFEAVLELMETKRLTTETLVTHRFPVARAAEAYDVVGGEQSCLGILFEYPPSMPAEGDARLERTIDCSTQTATGDSQPDSVRVAFLGAGNFSTRVLMPAFKRGGAVLVSVASMVGLSGSQAARRFGFDQATTDADTILANGSVDAVVVATRHDSHADYVCRALEAGKHVFVEKPLAIDGEQLERIREAYQGALSSGRAPVLMVGFNRRFAPHTVQIASLLKSVTGPKTFVMTVNAGAIPADSWVQDPAAGGGRIIGEACHFIDLLRHLAGHPIVAVQATQIGAASDGSVQGDKMSFTLEFADGSFGTVHYLANGHRAFPKERLEVFCAGRVIQVDNFRRLSAFGWENCKKMNLWKQDKGHTAEVQAFLAALRNGTQSPIPFDEAAEVTRVSFDVIKAAQSRETIQVFSREGT